eukprot:jgi/Picre1/33738/NNA_001217.t1
MAHSKMQSSGENRLGGEESPYLKEHAHSKMQYSGENRLGGEESPYLKEHAENPIHWFSWKDDDAPFKAAKELNRPVFLSVGYSTCHWCHVMARESFENEDIAAFLNSHFVCIKVDKEERPDVDAFYMKYVQATQGGGGWPMSVFLTPEKKPFFAGSYFPPDDRFGRPGFLTVITRIAEVWETRQRDVESSAEDVMQQLQKGVAMMSEDNGNVDGAPAGRRVLEACAAMLLQRYDAEHGGFGGPPKFPRPCEMQSLFMASHSHSQNAGNDDATVMQQATLSTLKKMAQGGLRDQLGGGFHRYSVDEIYHVPHFEIMLYDQPQIALTYLMAFQLTRDVYFSAICRGILDYMMESLKSPVHGGYFAAEDADSLCTTTMTSKEGAFYTWTTDQVDACDEMSHDMRHDCKTFFGITSQGNCTRSRLSDPHQEFIGTNVLYQAISVEDLAERRAISVGQMDEELSTMRKILYDARNKRPRPHRDEKIISAWNGMAMHIFALAGVVLESEDPPVEYSFPVRGVSPREVYLAEAENIAAFMQKTMMRQEQDATILYRSFVSKEPTIRGFSDDYSWTICGLISLFEATGNVKHLHLALNLQDSMDSLFWDTANKGYYQSDTASSGSLEFRLKDDYDGAEPAASSIAASNLIRLSALTDNQTYASRATDMIQSVSSRLEQIPLAMPQMCMAAYENEIPHTQVILIGQAGQPDYDALVTTAYSMYIPNKTIIQIDPDNKDTMEFWSNTNPRISRMVERNTKTIPTALVCANQTCQKPVHEAPVLESVLHRTSSKYTCPDS